MGIEEGDGEKIVGQEQEDCRDMIVEEKPASRAMGGQTLGCALGPRGRFLLIHLSSAGRFIILVLPTECWNNSQLKLQLNPLQLNRSAKSCQLCGTKIRWRTEQLSVGVTKMTTPALSTNSRYAREGAQ